MAYHLSTCFLHTKKKLFLLHLNKYFSITNIITFLPDLFILILRLSNGEAKHYNYYNTYQINPNYNPLYRTQWNLYPHRGFSEKPSLGWPIFHLVGLFLAGFFNRFIRLKKWPFAENNGAEDSRMGRVLLYLA